MESQIVGQIDQGLLALVGVGHDDTEEQAEWLAKKSAELRIFQDEHDKMNRSLLDVGGAMLSVSQFTLLGDCRKGRRPAFTDAAAPEIAKRLYQHYSDAVASHGIRVEQGIFAADMAVELVNDGPVTIILDRLP